MIIEHLCSSMTRCVRAICPLAPAAGERVRVRGLRLGCYLDVSDLRQARFSLPKSPSPLRVKTAERTLDVRPPSNGPSHKTPFRRESSTRPTHCKTTTKSSPSPSHARLSLRGAMKATFVRELDACDQIVSRLAAGGSSVVFSRDDNADRKQCLRPSIRVPTSSNQENCLSQSAHAVARPTKFAS